MKKDSTKRSKDSTEGNGDNKDTYNTVNNHRDEDYYGDECDVYGKIYY